MTEEELFNSYFADKQKRETIEKLGEVDRNALAHAVLLIGYSEHEDETTHTAEYKRILDLLKKAQQTNTGIEEIEAIFRENFSRDMDFLEKEKHSLFDSILGSKLSQYNYLLSQPDKVPIAENIKRACFSAKENKKSAERYNHIAGIIKMLELNLIKIEYPTLNLKVNDDPEMILKALSSIIEKPTRLAYQKTMLEPEWETFPLKWFSLHMPITQFRFYFNRHKSGQPLDSFVISYVDNNIKTIIKKFDAHFYPFFAERSIILHNTIHAYEQSLFAASICACLPLIEGSIFKFADYYHYHNGNLFTQKDGQKHLRLNSGSEIKEFTIGDLLKRSALSEIFDEHFINYFCDELYNERNPILHGETVSNLNQLNAAKKILTFDYLSDVMSTIIKENYSNDMDELLGEKIYNKLISGIPLSTEEHASIKEKIKKRSVERKWI